MRRLSECSASNPVSRRNHKPGNLHLRSHVECTPFGTQCSGACGLLLVLPTVPAGACFLPQGVPLCTGSRVCALPRRGVRVCMVASSFLSKVGSGKMPNPSINKDAPKAARLLFQPFGVTHPIAIATRNLSANSRHSRFHSSSSFSS